MTPDWECNCGDLRTCRDLYGNKHGAIAEMNMREGIIKEARAEAYKDAAKFVRNICKARSCENRCYHEHAIRARAKEVLE